MTIMTDLRRQYKQVEGDVLVDGVINEVRESIANILETTQGTRLFNRGFGAGLHALLFEPMNDITASLILLAIDQAMERHEPRAKLMLPESEVKADFDNNGFNVRLVFQISGRDEIGDFNAFLSREIR